MTVSPAYVVDASVGMKFFLVEPLSDRARALFAHLSAEPPGTLHVPDLFYVECANTLWKRVRRSGLSIEVATRHLRAIRGLALSVTPTDQLLQDALRIAIDLDITAYDACYVALSRRVGAPLVTTDERLARKAAGACEIMSLKDLPLSESRE